MAAKWQFLLTDTAFNPIGEILNAKERQINIGLNKLDNLTFKLRLDNPMADAVQSTMGYIKAYRSGVLTYYGPVISVEEAADTSGASVAVTSAGAGWILQHRLTGKSAVGRQFTVPTDRAVIANTLIAEANAENDTGIYTGNVVQAGSLVTTYTAGPYRMLYDVITELSTGGPGETFDWRILPVENFANGSVTTSKIGAFAALPVIGDYRSEAIFEFGTGRNNMKSYSRIVDRGVQANQVYHNASPGPNAPGYPTVVASDPTSIASYRMLEDVAQADILDPVLRQQLVNTHVSVRRFPRQVVKFEPHIDPQDTGNLPVYGTDYTVGDFVRVRVASSGVTRVDQWLRIWGIQFTVDDNGVERASAILAAQDN